MVFPSLKGVFCLLCSREMPLLFGRSIPLYEGWKAAIQFPSEPRPRLDLENRSTLSLRLGGAVLADPNREEGEFGLRAFPSLLSSATLMICFL